MPFYEDLSPYLYRRSAEEDALSVGWLADGHDFPVGEAPVSLVERLARLAMRHPVNRMRGWQECPFCDGEYPIEVEVDGERRAVGDAEIRVVGADGRTYAAPTLIAHYVAAHRYYPPAEFVQAVLVDLRAAAAA